MRTIPEYEYNELIRIGAAINPDSSSALLNTIRKYFADSEERKLNERKQLTIERLLKLQPRNLMVNELDEQVTQKLISATKSARILWKRGCIRNQYLVDMDSVRVIVSEQGISLNGDGVMCYKESEEKLLDAIKTYESEAEKKDLLSRRQKVIDALSEEPNRVF